MGFVPLQLLESFRRRFGGSPAIVSRAPGRVNLIGEHTDYNDGFVLPVAIDRAVYVAARASGNSLVSLLAVDFDDYIEYSLADIRYDGEHEWSNYPRGVTTVLQQQGYFLGGVQAAIHGNVPIGAGLSSSAAIEVAMAKAFQALYDLEIDPKNLALLAQKAENEFVGMKCGIMDQFISVLGRKDHALLVDCRSLEHELVPIPPGCVVLVANTMKKRGLVDSEYNRRRSECEEGVQLLKQHLPGIAALRDVSEADLREHGPSLPPVILKRCRHVVTENARVLRAVAALQRGDAAECGHLMVQSHASLRDDYEVSVRELDLMVEAAMEEEGVYGARMTGAGFGGCTVNLVQGGQTERIVASLKDRYLSQTGIDPDIYVCHVENGIEMIRMP